VLIHIKVYLAVYIVGLYCVFVFYFINIEHEMKRMCIEILFR